MLLASCVPAERQLLLLDLALADPALVQGTAAPWQAAGYVVEYRPGYPHLTRSDLARFGVVILLGGRGPAPATDAITLGDLALLTEWVPRGGVLVFGYAGDGEGDQDRWTMNRWLDASGAGIRIGDYVLEDTVRAAHAATEPRPPAHPSPDGPLHVAGLGDFPAGRDHALRLDDDRRALARTTATAFVRVPGRRSESRAGVAVIAASRVSRGLVLVASRHLLGALGAEVRASTRSPLERDSRRATATFLVALARWTRRPAEWAHVPAARGGRPLVLLGAPRPLVARPPRRDPPAAAVPVPLPLPAEEGDSTSALPAWMRRAGLRIAWARAPLFQSGVGLGTVLEFLDAGAFNVLASPVTPDFFRDTLPPGRRARNAAPPPWRVALSGLGSTSLRWFPLLTLESLWPPGDTVSPRCLLDEAVWTEGVRPLLRTIAAAARQLPDVVGGVALDLTVRSDTSTALLCDANAAVALPTLGRDAAWVARLLALSPAARYDSLLEAGLLGAYRAALEREVAARAANAREEVRRLHRGFLFALRFSAPPGEWWELGLLEGLGSADAPVIVWSREPDSRPLLATWRARRIHAVAAVQLAIDRVPELMWPRLRDAAFAANQGFWIGPVEALVGPPRGAAGAGGSDSLGRLIRRLTKER